MRTQRVQEGGPEVITISWSLWQREINQALHHWHRCAKVFHVKKSFSLS